MVQHVRALVRRRRVRRCIASAANASPFSRIASAAEASLEQRVKALQLARERRLTVLPSLRWHFEELKAAADSPDEHGRSFLEAYAAQVRHEFKRNKQHGPIAVLEWIAHAHDNQESEDAMLSLLTLRATLLRSGYAESADGAEFVQRRAALAALDAAIEEDSKAAFESFLVDLNKRNNLEIEDVNTLRLVIHCFAMATQFDDADLLPQLIKLLSPQMKAKFDLVESMGDELSEMYAFDPDEVFVFSKLIEELSLPPLQWRFKVTYLVQLWLRHEFKTLLNFRSISNSTYQRADALRRTAVLMQRIAQTPVSSESKQQLRVKTDDLGILTTQSAALCAALAILKKDTRGIAVALCETPTLSDYTNSANSAEYDPSDRCNRYSCVNLNAARFTTQLLESRSIDPLPLIAKALLSEGESAAALSCIMAASPTFSRNDEMQITGEGTLQMLKLLGDSAFLLERYLPPEDRATATNVSERGTVAPSPRFLLSLARDFTLLYVHHLRSNDTNSSDSKSSDSKLSSDEATVLKAWNSILQKQLVRLSLSRAFETERHTLRRQPVVAREFTAFATDMSKIARVAPSHWSKLKQQWSPQQLSETSGLLFELHSEMPPVGALSAKADEGSSSHFGFLAAALLFQPEHWEHVTVTSLEKEHVLGELLGVTLCTIAGDDQFDLLKDALHCWAQQRRSYESNAVFWRALVRGASSLATNNSDKHSRLAVLLQRALSALSVESAHVQYDSQNAHRFVSRLFASERRRKAESESDVHESFSMVQNALSVWTLAAAVDSRGEQDDLPLLVHTLRALSAFVDDVGDSDDETTQQEVRRSFSSAAVLWTTRHSAYYTKQQIKALTQVLTGEFCVRRDVADRFESALQECVKSGTSRQMKLSAQMASQVMTCSKWQTVLAHVRAYHVRLDASRLAGSTPEIRALARGMSSVTASSLRLVIEALLARVHQDVAVDTSFDPDPLGTGNLDTALTLFGVRAASDTVYHRVCQWIHAMPNAPTLLTQVWPSLALLALKSGVPATNVMHTTKHVYEQTLPSEATSPPSSFSAPTWPRSDLDHSRLCVSLLLHAHGTSSVPNASLAQLLSAIRFMETLSPVSTPVLDAALALLPMHQDLPVSLHMLEHSLQQPHSRNDADDVFSALARRLRTRFSAEEVVPLMLAARNLRQEDIVLALQQDLLVQRELRPQLFQHLVESTVTEEFALDWEATTTSYELE